MNTKQKGNKAENEAKKILESKGWIVEKARSQLTCIGPGRFIRSDLDYFGLYDLIAKHEGGETLWIQVKSTASGVSSAKKPIEDFEKYLGETELSVIVQKVARKGFVWYEYIQGNWHKKYTDLKGLPCEKFIISDGGITE